MPAALDFLNLAFPVVGSDIAGIELVVAKLDMAVDISYRTGESGL